MPVMSAQSHSSVMGICHRSCGTKGCWNEPMLMPSGDPTLPFAYWWDVSEKLGVRPVGPAIMSEKSVGAETKSGIAGMFPFESAGEKPLPGGVKVWWLLGLLDSPLNPCVKTFLGGEMLFDRGDRGAGRFSGTRGWLWGWAWTFGSSGSLVVFLFLRECDSFSALSRTTLAMRSNSEHTPNIRLTPLFSSSVLSSERKLTT